MKAVTLQSNVSLVLAICLASRCVGPLHVSCFNLSFEQHVGMSSGCMAVESIYWLVISNNFIICRHPVLFLLQFQKAFLQSATGKVTKFNSTQVLVCGMLTYLVVQETQP